MRHIMDKAAMLSVRTDSCTLWLHQYEDHSRRATSNARASRTCWSLDAPSAVSVKTLRSMSWILSAKYDLLYLQDSAESPRRGIRGDNDAFSPPEIRVKQKLALGGACRSREKGTNPGERGQNLFGPNTARRTVTWRSIKCSVQHVHERSPHKQERCHRLAFARE